MPDPRPISFLSLGTTPGPKSYSEEGCQGQPASKGSRVRGLSSQPLFLSLSAQRGSRK